MVEGCRWPDSNRHGPVTAQRILSPLRLPFRHIGRAGTHLIEKAWQPQRAQPLYALQARGYFSPSHQAFTANRAELTVALKPSDMNSVSCMCAESLILRADTAEISTTANSLGNFRNSFLSVADIRPKSECDLGTHQITDCSSRPYKVAGAQGLALSGSFTLYSECSESVKSVIGCVAAIYICRR